MKSKAKFLILIIINMIKKLEVYFLCKKIIILLNLYSQCDVCRGHNLYLCPLTYSKRITHIYF